MHCDLLAPPAYLGLFNLFWLSRHAYSIEFTPFPWNLAFSRINFSIKKKFFFFHHVKRKILEEKYVYFFYLGIFLFIEINTHDWENT